MKKLVIICALLAPSFASAGAIERACNASDRKSVSRSLCSCIQQAADATLTNSAQRKAAKFFKDPDKAQDTRQANGSSNETFWKRYKNFGATAEAWCTRSEATG